jgi:hypothetical protein
VPRQQQIIYRNYSTQWKFLSLINIVFIFCVSLSVTSSSSWHYGKFVLSQREKHGRASPALHLATQRRVLAPINVMEPSLGWRAVVQVNERDSRPASVAARANEHSSAGEQARRSASKRSDAGDEETARHDSMRDGVRPSRQWRWR